MSEMLKTRRAYAQLSDCVVQELDDRAASEGLTRSQFIRRTLLRELGLPQEPARVSREKAGVQ